MKSIRSFVSFAGATRNHSARAKAPWPRWLAWSGHTTSSMSATT